MSFFMENMKGKHAVEEPAVGGFGHFLATAPTTMATLWMKYSAAHVRECLPWEVVNISKQTHRSIAELVFGSFLCVFSKPFILFCCQSNFVSSLRVKIL